MLISSVVSFLYDFLPFLHWKPLKGYFGNSEDPDEMQLYAAFHQVLHCLLKLSNFQEQKCKFFL